MARKEKVELITGLDIGTTSIRIAVGQHRKSKGEDHLQIIGAIEVSSEGIQKGTITSIEDTVSAISGALEHAERLVGVPIEHVWVGVSGGHVLCQESRGVVAASRSDGEITHDDIDRAVEAARTVAAPLNYEVLHVLPRSFRVDGQTNIKDPVGMTGIRLEVDTNIIYGMSSHMKNLSKAVYRVGVDIDDFVLAILAGAETILDTRQKELGVVVVNIGGPTTSMVVYEEGEVMHTAVIPIGSDHVTNDLALGLKTSIDIAEQVKRRFGHCMSKQVQKRDMVDLFDCGHPDSEEVGKQYISKIIEARMSEILEKIDEQLVTIDRSQLLPAGAIFIGGGAKIKGLVDLARAEMSLPAMIGQASGIEGITDKMSDPGFVPAIGLVKWGQAIEHTGVTRKINFAFVNKASDKAKKIFKSLMP